MEAVSEIVGLFKIKLEDIPGIILAFAFVQAAKYITTSPIIASLGEIGKSAQLWAILLGMIGIILYGFKVTFQKISNIGVAALVVDVLIMATTSILSYYVGTKVLGMEKEPSLLAGCGSSICGVSAVMAAEPVVMATNDQTATTVATMVIYGTITMFAYPAMRDKVPFDDNTFGIYTGATLQDMGGVTAAGNMMNEEIAAAAVITKLARVMLLGPYLVLLASFSVQKGKGKTKINIPWYAVAFVVMVGVNSLDIVPKSTVKLCTKASGVMMLLAMVALGAGTNVQKVKAAGIKPVLLAGILCAHLIISGFFITQQVVAVLG